MRLLSRIWVVWVWPSVVLLNDEFAKTPEKKQSTHEPSRAHGRQKKHDLKGLEPKTARVLKTIRWHLDTRRGFNTANTRRGFANLRWWLDEAKKCLFPVLFYRHLLERWFRTINILRAEWHLSRKQTWSTVAGRSKLINGRSLPPTDHFNYGKERFELL